VAQERIAVMPAGIIEQHGPHLPLDTDILLAEEITRRAAAVVPEKVVVIPSITHGYSPHHMDFPGTLSVQAVHMMDYVLDVCFSLGHHGFRKVLIVNGHGGNRPILDLAARETIIRTAGKVACATIQYTDSKEAEKAIDELFPGASPWNGHADDVETSLYLAVRPQLVQLEKAHDDPSSGLMKLGSSGLPLRLYFSSFSKEGIYGTVGSADPRKGELLVAAAVKGLASIFAEFHSRQIPDRVDYHYANRTVHDSEQTHSQAIVRPPGWR
jgi:creatinine amidohydrolase